MTSSVAKVIDGFARSTFSSGELVVASLGGRRDDAIKHGRRYLHFSESAWRNRLYNKMLGLGLFTFPSLVELLERERPDIVHFHNRHELVDRVISKLSFLPKVVCHYHRKFDQFIFPSCADYYLAVSQDLANSIRALVMVPVDYIYNPTPDFPLRSKGLERIGGDVPVFLYAGGRQVKKGFDDLLSAIDGLPENFPARLLLCGPKLEGFSPSQEWVENVGMLKHDDFAKALEGCDVVVMPTHHEGFSLLALEALASGKILISTLAGGMAELVDAECACIFNVGDAAGLREHLVNVSGLFQMDSEVLHRISSAAQKKAACFSAQSVSDKLFSIYGSLYG